MRTPLFDISKKLAFYAGLLLINAFSITSYAAKEDLPPPKAETKTEIKAPTKEANEAEKPEKATDKTEAKHSETQAQKPTPEDAFEMPEYLSPLHLGLGMGMYTLSSSTASTWRARGGSDLSAGYTVANIADKPLEVLIRYIAIPVAPSFKHSNSTEDQYVGVVSSYLLGTQWQAWSQDTLDINIAGLMGLTHTSLSPLIDKPTSQAPSKWGFVAIASSEIMWEVVESFSIGPRLGLGFGSFTSFQLNANLRFSF